MFKIHVQMYLQQTVHSLHLRKLEGYKKRTDHFHICLWYQTLWCQSCKHLLCICVISSKSVYCTRVNRAISCIIVPVLVLTCTFSLSFDANIFPFTSSCTFYFTFRVIWNPVRAAHYSWFSTFTFDLALTVT